MTSKIGAGASCVSLREVHGKRDVSRPMVDRRHPVLARMASTVTARSHATRVARKLAQLYPDAECALVHESPLELLIATILSAQCTDAAGQHRHQGPVPAVSHGDGFRAGVLSHNWKRRSRAPAFFATRPRTSKACCQAPGRPTRRRSAARHGKPGRTAGRRTQNGQRRAGDRLRHRVGRGGRYARRPA